MLNDFGYSASTKIVEILHLENVFRNRLHGGKKGHPFLIDHLMRGVDTVSEKAHIRPFEHLVCKGIP